MATICLIAWLAGFGLSLPHHPAPDPCSTFGRIIAVEHRDAWEFVKLVPEGYMMVQEVQKHPETWTATLQYTAAGRTQTVERIFEEEVQVGGGFPVVIPCSEVTQ